MTFATSFETGTINLVAIGLGGPDCGPILKLPIVIDPEPIPGFGGTCPGMGPDLELVGTGPMEMAEFGMF